LGDLNVSETWSHVDEQKQQHTVQLPQYWLQHHAQLPIEQTNKKDTVQMTIKERWDEIVIQQKSSNFQESNRGDVLRDGIWLCTGL
jgi:hypothetical protein